MRMTKQPSRRFLHKELRPNCRPIKSCGLPASPKRFRGSPLRNSCFSPHPNSWKTRVKFPHNLGFFCTLIILSFVKFLRFFFEMFWAILPIQGGKLKDYKTTPLVAVCRFPLPRLSIPDIDTYFASYRMETQKHLTKKHLGGRGRCWGGQWVAEHQKKTGRKTTISRFQYPRCFRATCPGTDPSCNQTKKTISKLFPARNFLNMCSFHKSGQANTILSNSKACSQIFFETFSQPFFFCLFVCLFVLFCFGFVCLFVCLLAKKRQWRWFFDI